MGEGAPGKTVRLGLQTFPTFSHWARFRASRGPRTSGEERFLGGTVKTYGCQRGSHCYRLPPPTKPNQLREYPPWLAVPHPGCTAKFEIFEHRPLYIIFKVCNVSCTLKTLKTIGTGVCSKFSNVRPSPDCLGLEGHPPARDEDGH